jgi:hypothetical protein
LQAERSNPSRRANKEWIALSLRSSQRRSDTQVFDPAARYARGLDERPRNQWAQGMPGARFPQLNLPPTRAFMRE